MAKVELYTREHCPHCENIKKVLNASNVSFIEHKVDVEITPAQVKEKFPGAVQLPVIVVDDNWIENTHDIRRLLLG